MILERNSQVLNQLCFIEIKSIRFSSLIPDFINIYSTPSKLTLTVSPKKTDNGIEYTTLVSLSYPGLKNTDFYNFHKLLHDKFILKIYFSSEDIYQLGTIDIPLVLTTKYSSPKGFLLTFKNKSFFTPSYIGTNITNNNSSSLTTPITEYEGVYEAGVYEIGVFE